MKPNLEGDPFASSIARDVLTKIGITYGILVLVIYGLQLYLGMERVDLTPWQCVGAWAVIFFFGFAPGELFREQGFVPKCFAVLCAAILSVFFAGAISLLVLEVMWLWDWSGIHMPQIPASFVLALSGAYGAAHAWGAFYARKPPPEF